jgi:large subunit ribosomal protein L40e
MILNIKSYVGKGVVLSDVKSSDTILDLKNVIQKKRGIYTEMQRLLYDGQSLEDDMTLEYYNIETESTVYLVYNTIKK